VAAAVDKLLNPGDIVYVMAGTYAGEIKPHIDGTASLPIRFIADRTGAIFGTAGDVTLTGASGQECMEMDDTDYLEFVGFRIDGANTGLGQQAVELDKCNGIVFEQCEVFGAGLDGIDTNLSTLTIINCLIYDNGTSGGYFHANSMVTVWNSTFAHNGGDGVHCNSGTTTVRNCIIAYNTGDGFDRNGGTLSHTYNIVYGNSSNNFEGTSASTGELTSDPQFTDAAGRNYTLQSVSPAIDAGTDAAGTVDVDIDDIARPVNSAWDIGCYEYVGGLLGHWVFDEGSGSSAADSSVAANDATLQGGATWTSDCVGNTAIEFDGSGDDAITAQPFSPPATVTAGVSLLNDLEQFTLAGWIRPNNVTPEISLFGQYDLIELGISNQYNKIVLDTNAGGTVVATGYLPIGKWSHVAATGNGVEMKLYINGNEVASGGSATADYGNNSEVFKIGEGVLESNDDYFDGRVDDVRIFSRAMCPEEIRRLYKGGRPPGIRIIKWVEIR